MKKLVLLILSVLAFIPVASQAANTPPQAPGLYSYINHSTIESPDGAIYVDGGSDSNHVFVGNPQTVCRVEVGGAGDTSTPNIPGTIYDGWAGSKVGAFESTHNVGFPAGIIYFSSSNHANYQTGANAQIAIFAPISDTDNVCTVTIKGISINPTTIGNQNVEWRFTNANTITSIGDGGDYSNSQGQDQVFSNSSSGSVTKYNGTKSGQKCQDFITVGDATTPNGDATTTDGTYNHYTDCSSGKIKSYAILIGGTASNPVNTNPNPNPAATQTDPCADATGAYAWMVCPAFNEAQQFLGTIYNDLVAPLLQVNPLSTKDGKGADTPIFTVYKHFLQLADILFVLTFLFLIFGTVLNLDAYTVKKALPRVVIAAIGVQFSFFICGIIIDIGNVLGFGIMSLVGTLTGGSATHNGGDVAQSIISNGLFGLGGLIVAGAAITIFAPTAILLMLGLLIAVITFVFTLLVRQILINVLILLAPIAIVAWVLPNTQSLARRWAKEFTRLIFLFPIISLVVSAGYIVQAAGIAAGGQIQQLVGGIAPIITFFMMPAAFKWSGGAMSAIAGAASKFGSGRSDAIKNSQMVKDQKAAYKGRAAQKALDPNASGFGKRVAAVRAGGFGAVIPSAATNRRLAIAGAAHTKLQADEAAQQITAHNGGAGFDNDELKALAKGVDTNGVKATEGARTKAIQMLAERQQWGTIRQMRKDGGISEGQLNHGLTGTDAAKKASDLVMGREKAFSGVTAQKFAEMHSSTQGEYMDYLKSDASKNTEGHTTRVAEFQNAVQGTISTPGLRNQVSSSTGARIRKETESGGLITDTTVHTLVTTSIKEDGTITAPSTSGPTPPPQHENPYGPGGGGYM